MSRTLSMCFITFFFGGGEVGWDGDCFFHRDWWPRHYGFWKVTFTFLLTFFYKHKNAYHRNFCRSSVNWYQEAGNPRCDGGRLVLPEQSSCNSFCLRRVPKQKNPHGSNHFLQAKQHWLHMDNKRRLRSNYICIRTSLMKEKCTINAIKLSSENKYCQSKIQSNDSWKLAHACAEVLVVFPVRVLIKHLL